MTDNSSMSMFYVPTEPTAAIQEASYIPSLYSALVEKRKQLRLQELAYQFELDKIKDANYFKERINQSQKDAEKASKLSGSYEEVYRNYILIYTQREYVEGLMRSIELKAKTLDTIIRSDISERYIQQ